MSKFDVKQGDLTVEARYEAPAFALLRPEGQRLVETVVTQLAPYGASVDTVFYSTEGALGARNVTINAPGINAGVKIFVARAEAGFNDLKRARFADIETIARILFESIEKAAPDVRFSIYSVSLNYHGLVERMAVADFIKQYVGNAPNLGPLHSTAAGFYYAKKGARNWLSIVMDASLSVPDALFMRISALFDGKRISHAQLPGAGAAMLAEVLAGFKLEHELDLGQKR